mmetsp:Transcript_24431/g.92257  ORF Transcript_24431/g.92257 Transcript_24431/m.92257 type:complete len:219 (-) Transcript_24431:881-1537(-)
MGASSSLRSASRIMGVMVPSTGGVTVPPAPGPTDGETAALWCLAWAAAAGPSARATDVAMLACAGAGAARGAGTGRMHMTVAVMASITSMPPRKADAAMSATACVSDDASLTAAAAAADSSSWSWLRSVAGGGTGSEGSALKADCAKSTTLATERDRSLGYAHTLPLAISRSEGKERTPKRRASAGWAAASTLATVTGARRARRARATFSYWGAKDLQ